MPGRELKHVPLDLQAALNAGKVASQLNAAGPPIGSPAQAPDEGGRASLAAIMADLEIR